MPLGSLTFPPGMASAWLLPALCLGAFLTLAVSLLLGAGNALPGKGAPLSLAAIGAAFAAFFPIAADFLAHGQPGQFAVVW
ncbi:MAG: hypothetical protein NTZ05_04795, partial [Chloroflexi bacterium]|nr:hypothetical protein [Chloroflexota bacterium]